MFYARNVILFYVFCYFSVQCLIPTLKVQKLDRKLIERKRQDTLDMCKLFTEENNRIKRLKMSKKQIVNQNILNNPRRFKRDLNLANSSLNIVEAKRVEAIVDKLYDDMAERGERVTYRQRNLASVQSPKTLQNQTGRRFNFAPAELLPPKSTEQTMVDEHQDVDYQIPWPKHWKHGIVPYFIDPNTYDTRLSDIIISAFDYFEKATCIRLQRLREKPTDKDSLQKVEWLYITNPSGIRQCVHSNEKKSNKGVQMVVFGYNCLSLGEVLHEVMHILGFSHEHTRSNRDQYITVLWDNIKPGYKKYFEVRPTDPLSSLPYDYSSVLHYPARAFSKNGQITLLAEAAVKLGQREGLSDNDIAKVATIYSPECTKRNKEYLLNTCPSVVKIQRQSINVTQNEIEKYFEDRIWPYGLINYRIRDKMEFSTEERENLDAVIRHIQKETCIEFRDTSIYDVEDNEKSVNNSQDTNLNLTSKEKLMEKESDNNNNEDDNNTENDNIPTEASNVTEEKLNEPISINENSLKESNEAGSDEKEKSKEIDENIIDRRKKNVYLKSSYTFGSLSKGTNSKRKLRRRPAKVAGRRHAASTMTLVRSTEPGCPCPPPGRPKGDQIVKINADCFNSVNDLLHLFVHILGLDHQHNMHDRDSYLHILWDKLTPEMRMEIQNTLPPAAAVGFPYDYQSVMHYPWLQIKNGVTNVMYPIWNDGWAMGHWQGLSSTDVNKLNLIYYKQCTLRKQEATNKN